MKYFTYIVLITFIFAEGCWGQQSQTGSQQQQGTSQQQTGQQQGSSGQQQPGSGQQPQEQQSQQGLFGNQQPLLFIPNHNPVQSIFNPFIHFINAGAYGIMEVGKNIVQFPLNVLKTGQVYLTSALNSFASPQWVPPSPEESPLLNYLNRLSSSTTPRTTTSTTQRPRPPQGG